MCENSVACVSVSRIPPALCTLSRRAKAGSGTRKTRGPSSYQTPAQAGPPVFPASAGSCGLDYFPRAGVESLRRDRNKRDPGADQDAAPRVVRFAKAHNFEPGRCIWANRGSHEGHRRWPGGCSRPPQRRRGSRFLGVVPTKVVDTEKPPFTVRG